jgi:hypothetical protein
MASGDNEHRMLFDIRGRRKNVVKVVYAVLAILMGASLFVAVGPFNIGELFNQESAGSAAEPFEEQQERIEVKLKKDPDNPDLLLSLARAQVNTGNALVTIEPNGERTMTLDALQEYQQASGTWSEYLEATDKPSASAAQLMAPALLSLAEMSRSYNESLSNLDAAVQAQKIVAEQRPSINAFSTLALYTYFTGDFAAADKARAEAEKFAKGKLEQESLDTQLDEAKKRAEGFQKEVKEFERESKKAGKGGGATGTPESLENPQNPLGGAFGGSGQLTE